MLDRARAKRISTGHKVPHFEAKQEKEVTLAAIWLRLLAATRSS